MRLFTSGVLLVGFLGAGVAGAACATSDGPADAVDPSLADVVFLKGATPRALGSLLDATPIPDVTLAPTLLEPANNAVLLASQKVVFEWSRDGMTAMRTAPGATTPALPTPAFAALAAGPTLFPAGETALDKTSTRSFPAWLGELIGPERTALAAPATLDQKGYFLLFSTDSTPRLLRVFTTETTYTPDAKAWKTLADAGTWTKLIVVAGAFLKDDLVVGTGPFVGAPILFCIEPG